MGNGVGGGGLLGALVGCVGVWVSSGSVGELLVLGSLFWCMMGMGGVVASVMFVWKGNVVSWKVTSLEIKMLSVLRSRSL